VSRVTNFDDTRVVFVPLINIKDNNSNYLPSALYCQNQTISLADNLCS